MSSDDETRHWEDDTYLYGEQGPPSNAATTTTLKQQPADRSQRKRQRDDDSTTIIDLVEQSLPDIQSFLGGNPSKTAKVKKEGGGITCRACKRAYFVNKKGSKLVPRIAKLIKDYAYSMSTEALIEEIHYIGEAERQEMIEDGEDDPGEWTNKEIEYHLFNCMTDAGLFSLKQINDLRDELGELGKHLWKNNPDGTREPDKHVFGLFFATQTQIRQFLTLAPEKTISFNPRLNVQLSSKKAL